MPIDIRRATQDDFTAIAEIDMASFGEEIVPEQLADSLPMLDPDRFLVATDAGRIVGVTGDYPFTMTVPGGALDVPGVTWVSVDVTYRRRGVLRGLMQRQLADYRDAGYPAAILTASEGGIYGRFGYGAASQVRRISIDRRLVRLLEPGDPAAVERLNGGEARKRLPEIHERWCAQTPGALHRNDGWWDLLTADREWQRDGMSPQFHLVHADGYVSYRIKANWNDGDPRHLAWITDYVIGTPRAHRDLWQVLLGLDLVGSIESYRIPIDDPLPYLLDNGRQVRTTNVGDGVWVRPLDAAAMLSARTYAVDVSAVLEITDGDDRSRFCLEGGPGGATCEPTSRAPDVSLDVAALGSLYLGGNRVAPLVAAGRVSGGDAALLTRLDRALLADVAPRHGTGF